MPWQGGVISVRVGGLLDDGVGGGPPVLAVACHVLQFRHTQLQQHLWHLSGECTGCKKRKKKSVKINPTNMDGLGSTTSSLTSPQLNLTSSTENFAPLTPDIHTIWMAWTKSMKKLTNFFSLIFTKWICIAGRSPHLILCTLASPILSSPIGISQSDTLTYIYTCIPICITLSLSLSHTHTHTTISVLLLGFHKRWPKTHTPHPPWKKRGPQFLTPTQTPQKKAANQDYGKNKGKQNMCVYACIKRSCSLGTFKTLWSMSYSWITETQILHAY